MTRRWKQRPAGSTWGDWGDEDQLGRLNLLTPGEGVAGRARGQGRHHVLSEPPARLPRRHALNQARTARIWPDRGHERRPGNFFNIRMTDGEFGDPQYIDVFGDDT